MNSHHQFQKKKSLRLESVFSSPHQHKHFLHSFRTAASKYFFGRPFRIFANARIRKASKSFPRPWLQGIIAFYNTCVCEQILSLPRLRLDLPTKRCLICEESPTGDSRQVLAMFFRFRTCDWAASFRYFIQIVQFDVCAAGTSFVLKMASAPNKRPAYEFDWHSRSSA